MRRRTKEIRGLRILFLSQFQITPSLTPKDAKKKKELFSFCEKKHTHFDFFSSIDGLKM